MVCVSVVFTLLVGGIQSRNPFNGGVVASRNWANQDPGFVNFWKLVESGCSTYFCSDELNRSELKLLKWASVQSDLLVSEVIKGAGYKFHHPPAGSASAVYFFKSMGSVVKPLSAGRIIITLLFWRFKEGQVFILGQTRALKQNDESCMEDKYSEESLKHMVRWEF